MDDYIKVPIIQFNQNYMVVYTEVLNRQFSYKSQENLMQNKANYAYNGYMSKNTINHVKKLLTTWTNCIYRFKKNQAGIIVDKKPYLTFVTLTLSSKQAHSDNDVKRKCLTPFIQELIRVYGVQYYFWRAESQKNGNIHFHMVIDSYIHWKQLRDLWNKHQESLKYITEYTLKTGKDDPNSTDVHKLQKIRNVANYVCKYVTKDTDERQIKGRIWGCSEALHTCKPYSMILHHTDEIIIDKLKEVATPREVKTDNFHYFGCKVYEFLEKYFPETFKKVLKHHNDLYYNLYSNEGLFKKIPEIIIDTSPPITITKITDIQYSLFN